MACIPLVRCKAGHADRVHKSKVRQSLTKAEHHPSKAQPAKLDSFLQRTDTPASLGPARHLCAGTSPACALGSWLPRARPGVPWAGQVCTAALILRILLSNGIQGWGWTIGTCRRRVPFARMFVSGSHAADDRPAHRRRQQGACSRVLGTCRHCRAHCLITQRQAMQRWAPGGAPAHTICAVR